MTLSSTPVSNQVSAMQQELAATATAALIFEDGSVLWGDGIGAEVGNIGELCFNTAMTGYQEILTDLSYAGQIICFTSAHIGNVGTNSEDNESAQSASLGCVLRNKLSRTSNYRSTMDLDNWLKLQGIPGIANVDTRVLTHQLREKGSMHAMLVHDPKRQWDIPKMAAEVRAWSGLEGQDLAIKVTSDRAYEWLEGTWRPEGGFKSKDGGTHRVTVIDFGVKHNILRLLADRDCTVTVLPANATFEQLMASNPDGVLLSNGPGDPAATGVYAVPMIKALIEKNVPICGICLGHQMLALALGAETRKMETGHHGANHPVRNFGTGRAEITSQNHGFVVDGRSLPEKYTTHASLFDGTVAGLADPEGKFFSVQYHPEASPGPMDSGYLFDHFKSML